MTSTRLIYPDSMPWSAEDEAKYAALADPAPVADPVDFEPVIDDRPAGGWARHVVDLGERNGIRTRLHFQDNEIIPERIWDAAPDLKYAAEMRAQVAGRTLKDGINSAGRMPMAILGQAINEGWINDPAAVMKWYRDNPKFIIDERLISK